MIYSGAANNFWAAEVTGKSHRVALPPRPQQQVGVRLGGGERVGGCVGRGGQLRPETSQSGAGLGRISARGGAWPSGKAVAELCVALCQRQQLLVAQ